MDETIKEIMRLAESEEGERLAKEALEYYKGHSEGRVKDIRDYEIFKVLKVAYIAERFFGKSRSWICHKLNHDIKNGKPDCFTAAETAKLKDALDTIAMELKAMSDEL